MDQLDLTGSKPRATADPTKTSGPFYDEVVREGIIYGLLCFLAALINFATQSVLSRFLRPGEFGTLNAVFGIIGLFGIPLAVVNQSLSHFLAAYLAQGEAAKVLYLRQCARHVLDVAAINIGIFSIFVVGVVESTFAFPRATLWSLSTLAVGLSLGATVSTAFQQGASRFRFWGGLLIGGALVRLILGSFLAQWSPWAESGVLASMGASFVLIVPLLLRPDPAITFKGWESFRPFLQPVFLKYAGACASVSLGLYLFSNADQFVAQRWRQLTPGESVPVINSGTYDAYQAAGLLGRALIWGSAPLLTLLYIEQSSSTKLNRKTGKLALLYAALLLTGAILLPLTSAWLVHLFPDSNMGSIKFFIPRFALAMVPLGLLQLAGLFFLASRRFVESYALGGLGVGYLFLLLAGGHRPEMMLVFMFAGGSLSLMALFCLSIVLWSRGRP